MSPCHDLYDDDLYDTVALSLRRRAVPAVGTQCHDPYPAFEDKDDDEPAAESQASRPLEYA